MNDSTATSAPAMVVVTNWVSRIIAAGGASPSANTILTMTVFATGLYDKGIAAKMININCMVPDNITAAITPLIATQGSGSTGVSNTWSNSGFAGTDLSVAGLKGNGSNYLKTGVSPSSVINNNIGLSLYNTFNVSDSRNDFASPATQLIVNYGPGSVYWSCYTDVITGTPFSDNIGFVTGNRTDSTHSYLYKARSDTALTQIAGPGSTPGTSTTYDLWLFCLNNNGSPYGQSNKRFSFAGIHNGLTATEAGILFTLVQAMRTSLGGGYS